MPLQKQAIALNFGQGVEQKVDPKLVMPGKLLLLENGRFQKANRISKRPGYRILAAKTLDGNNLTNGDSLAIFNNELLQYNKQSLYSLSQASERWINKGSCVSAIVKTRQIVKNTASQSQTDSAYNNGVTVYAWEDSRGGVRASVYDETTQTAMLSDVLLDASASRVRCLAFGSSLYVFYYNSGSLYVRRINSKSPTAFDAAVTISATVNTSNPTYDITTYAGNRILWAHNVQGASQIKAGWLDDTPTVLTGTLAPVTISEAATSCLSLVQGPFSTFYVVYHNGTNGLRCVILNKGAATLYGPLTVDSTTSPTIVNATGYAARDGSGVTLYYEVSASATYNHFVKTNTVSTAGIAGTSAVFLRSVGLATKAFTYTSSSDTADRAYVGLAYDSTLQATYFLARNDGLIVAKQQAGLGGGLGTRPILANVSRERDSVYSYAIINKTELISENATLFSTTGVAGTKVDFSNSNVFKAAQLGNNLHIVGGVLSMYDGLSIVEHGFHLYPENLSYVTTSSGGSVHKGVYQYIAVFEWTDNFGQRHRSAPSVAMTVDISSSGTDTNKNTVTIPTLRLTQKKASAGRSEVSVALYRTEASGSIFFRVTSVTSPTFNDTTADTISFDDTLSDAGLISNEILYTAGGELENASAPSSSEITVFKNRIFLSGLEDENLFWYSKIHSNNQPVEFAAELTKSVEPVGGGISALAVLDDKVVIFKEDRYYITYGDGPNNAGQLGEFAEPQFITTDVGCTDAKSIVRFPGGLLFKSKKGRYALSSELQPSYIGSSVENYNNLTTTSAVLDDGANLVRFTASDGVCLVYDYFFQQWGWDTNLEAKDAVMWNGQYVVLKTSGDVWVEDRAYFRDVDQPYRLRIGTGWLAFDSVVGFQRVYRVALLGEWKSPHILSVKVGYDYSDTYPSTIIFSPDTALPISYFGDDPVFGSSEVFGGPNSSYRFNAHLTQQKCQAIRFLIEDLTTSATSGSQEAFTISTLGLLVGIKGGLGRFKSEQSIGTAS